MKRLLAIAFALSAPTAMAATEVEMLAVNVEGTGDPLGTITFEDSEYGLLITPDLEGLEPGPHGLHVHQNANCDVGEKDGKLVPALGAGSHFDPEDTGKHRGPYDDSGHLGDLPVLPVDEDGSATTTLLAPRLEEDDLSDRAVIVHEGGDTYSDDPELGGGKGRVACGTTE